MLLAATLAASAAAIDWSIDLGPEGGDEGEQAIVGGRPEEVATRTKSYTGQFLKKVLTR